MRLWLMVAFVSGGAACEAPLPPRPLPELVVSTRSRVVARQGYWRAGERMAWSIHWRGVAIGRAQVVVGREPAQRRTIVARFLPASFARAVQPPVVVESSAQATGEIHTLHSALGWLRAWSVGGQGRAKLELQHSEHRYRVLVAEPVIEPGTELVRVHVRATPKERPSRESIDIQVWITMDEKRSLQRVVLERDGHRILATLSSHEQ